MLRNEGIVYIRNVVYSILYKLIGAHIILFTLSLFAFTCKTSLTW